MTTATGYVHKTEKLAETARENGWEAKIRPVLNDNPNLIRWDLRCVRRPEALQVTYVGNRLTEALYICGEKVTAPPHKAAVVKILTGTPDMAKMNAQQAQKHKKIPFNPNDPMPSRILDALLGKKINWTSQYTDIMDSERIEVHRNKGNQYYRIVRSAHGRRYVEFTGNSGFRAVYLDAIVSVT